MPRRTGPTNDQLKKLIAELKELGYKGNKFAARIAKDLEKPSRIRREVGLSNINRTAKEGETVVVPGKVLDGIITKKVEVACWNISATARKHLEAAGGSIITINELIKNGKTGRIMG
jgi:large subunit ribosomal protein L18e